MQTSNYLKTFPFRERPGYCLAYSTRKASVALLKEETFQFIENGLLSPEDEAMLLKLGVIVADREAEKKDILGTIDRLNEKNKGLNISAFINLDCNFACTYCYEGDMKDKIYMSDEIADLLIKFIKEKFGPDKNALNIDFYGGEPLLSIGLIKYISGAMKAFTETRGAEYTFTLVTNGSLLKRRVAEELYPLGLRRAKITIDGPAETHNITRPFKSGAASFDTIIKNIKETCDIIKIGVGGNYTRENHKKFLSLLDNLKTEGLTPDRLSQVKFDPVMNRTSEETGAVEYVDGCMSVNEPWISEAEALLREEIMKVGYSTPKISPSPCMVELKNTYVVNHDGALYKCPALIGKKGFEVGDVRTGVKDYSISHRVGIWKNDECIDCAYLPLCFGGCRYMAYVRDGNLDRPDCRKSYLDASLEGLIKQEIKYRKKES